ncbi:MAG TPA: DUF5838 family protein [Polyangiaceae bacterium]|jgi:LynF/TruF/PatF family peptide O-prenyltransferase|nr:DUF5838 family protein [Polyangiaceae bacterium]
MEVARHPHRLGDVTHFYESPVVIDTFNAGFAGRWHTRIVPDADGPKTSEDYVAGLLGLRPEHDVLDFGCGVGVVAASLAKNTGAFVHGLNISARQLENARRHANDAGVASRVVFDLYEGRSLPYPTASFDRAYFFESVCHVPDKPALFEGLFRVLRPGGVLAGQDWLVTRSELSPEEYRDHVHAIEASCEVRLATLDEYRKMLEHAGFVNVRTVDARDIYAGMAAAFTPPNGEATRIEWLDDLPTRLAKGNLALSNAFHRGLFTIGFVRAEKPEKTRPSGRIRPDGTDHETGTVDCLATSKNVAVVERHAALFDVAPSPALAAFTRLAGEATASSVEASCKVDDGVRHSARYNLFFHDDPGDAYARVRSFFDALGETAKLDATLVDEFVGAGLDFGRVQKVVTGIDVRATPGASRAKLWFMLGHYTEKVERALAMAGDEGRVRALLLHLPFLVGFDLHFDGATRIKLYPDVRPEELADARVGRALSSEAVAAMAQCSWTHLYFASPHAPLTLQLHPRDPDAFVGRYLAPELAEPIHRRYEGSPLLDMVVSLPHDDVGNGKARRFGLYYMPRGNVPAANGRAR